MPTISGSSSSITPPNTLVGIMISGRVGTSSAQPLRSTSVISGVSKHVGSSIAQSLRATSGGINKEDIKYHIVFDIKIIGDITLTPIRV